MAQTEEDYKILFCKFWACPDLLWHCEFVKGFANIILVVHIIHTDYSKCLRERWWCSSFSPKKIWSKLEIWPKSQCATDCYHKDLSCLFHLLQAFRYTNIYLGTRIKKYYDIFSQVYVIISCSKTKNFINSVICQQIKLYSSFTWWNYSEFLNRGPFFKIKR